MFDLPLPILILQHPQEPSRRDHAISSVPILESNLNPLHVATGLSWKNLAQATRGFQAVEAFPELQSPGLWHTLYLGTKKQGEAASESEPGIYYLDKKGLGMMPDPVPEMGGLIVLDGTWSQAKTLWWRNAWLLKTQRIYIVPKAKSLYGDSRKEPRPECVSTLEAVAETLSFLGIADEVEQKLKTDFRSAVQEFKRTSRN